ncbi:hypothetical protein EUX98_g9350 [Antrodiella citrinella]|uniref:Uncharacterized protein n=1 Tax=Antrodiella citrinella TaxID=2447956 RepID=A0A4S4LUK6_9APHY|nr:hypothetical protein EUX98_g9350 [Antrodiella citrinella]
MAIITLLDGTAFTTTVDPTTQRHHVECDMCGKAIILTVNAHPRAMQDHRGSKSCREAERKRVRAQTQAESAAASLLAAGIQAQPNAQPRIRHTPQPTPGASTSHSSASSARTSSQRPTALHIPRLSSIASTPTTPSQSRPHSPYSAVPSTHAPSPARSGTCTPSHLRPPIPSLFPENEDDDEMQSPDPPDLPHIDDDILATGAPAAAAPETTAPKAVECNGVVVEWLVGSAYSTYAFRMHDIHELPWRPVAFLNDRWMRLQAEDCLTSRPSDHDSCARCHAIPLSARYREFIKRAKEASSHTPWEYLNFTQLMAVARRIQEKYHKALIKINNMDRKLARKSKLLNDHQRLIMLCAKNDVQSLRRLLAVWLRRGANPNMIIRQVERAPEGLYRPKQGYTDRDIDVAFLARALGGDRLLYALSHSSGLPSASTVNRRVQIPKLTPCIGAPTVQHIHDNISSMFHPDVKPAPTGELYANGLPGCSLCIDGLALEPKCRYHRASNSACGHRPTLMSCALSNVLNTSDNVLSRAGARMFEGQQAQELLTIPVNPNAGSIQHLAVFAPTSHDTS